MEHEELKWIEWKGDLRPDDNTKFPIFVIKTGRSEATYISHPAELERGLNPYRLWCPASLPLIPPHVPTREERESSAFKSAISGFNVPDEKSYLALESVWKAGKIFGHTHGEL